MNPTVLWNALRKNISLVLLLVAAACPVLAMGQVVRGVSWTLLMPVALVAVLCGWWAGRSRFNGKQAAGWLVALGLPAIFIYVVKLVGPLGNFVISAYSIVPQIVRWLGDRTPLTRCAPSRPGMIFPAEFWLRCCAWENGSGYW